MHVTLLCFVLSALSVIRNFMNIHPLMCETLMCETLMCETLMCETLMCLPTSEETSGEVTILLETSPEVSN